MPYRLEVCIEDTDGIRACVDGGADRIELCSALALGGLTPSRGLMEAAAGCGIPAYALIRPRAGDFCYDADEIAVMCADILAARQSGLAGVVIGAADPDNLLDIDALERLSAAATGMGRSLHRVFDILRDPIDAIDKAARLGFERILTSGQAGSAEHGVLTLARMQAHAAGRIEIMAGAGVHAGNVAYLAEQTGITSFHASCSSATDVDPALLALGFAAKDARFTDPAKIRTMKASLRMLGAD